MFHSKSFNFNGLVRWDAHWIWMETHRRVGFYDRWSLNGILIRFEGMMWWCDDTLMFWMVLWLAHHGESSWDLRNVRSPDGVTDYEELTIIDGWPSGGDVITKTCKITQLFCTKPHRHIVMICNVEWCGTSNEKASPIFQRNAKLYKPCMIAGLLFCLPHYRDWLW